MKNTVVGEGGCGLVEGGQGEDTAQEPGQHTESGTAAVAEETVEVLGVTHVHVAAQRDAHQWTRWNLQSWKRGRLRSLPLLFVSFVIVVVVVVVAMVVWFVVLWCDSLFYLLSLFLFFRISVVLFSYCWSLPNLTAFFFCSFPLCSWYFLSSVSFTSLDALFAKNTNKTTWTVAAVSVSVNPSHTVDLSQSSEKEEEEEEEENRLAGFPCNSRCDSRHRWRLWPRSGSCWGQGDSQGSCRERAVLASWAVSWCPPLPGCWWRDRECECPSSCGQRAAWLGPPATCCCPQLRPRSSGSPLRQR